MRQDLTDITMVIDRSGSMASCKSDAEGGVNTFIEQHKAGPGEAVFKGHRRGSWGGHGDPQGKRCFERQGTTAKCCSVTGTVVWQMSR